MLDPEQFLALASTILQGTTGAAQAQTAIGRAYYATFLRAKVALEPYFRFSKQSEIHRQINMLFVNCSSPLAKEIGQIWTT